MPIPTYTSGYPPDGSSLGQTKSTIRNNLDGTFQTLNVDHVNNNGQPGSNPAGYHTIIHQVTQSAVTTVTGVNQIFSAIPNTVTINGSPITNPVPNTSDTQLFSLTGGGQLSQLTGSLPSGNGYAWIGGVLLQWGAASTSTPPTQVNFPVKFPNAAFAVVCNVFNSGSNVRSVSEVSGVNQTGFTPISTNSSNQIYFIAIGN